MKSRIKIISALIITLLFLSVSVFSCVCVRSKITINGFRGKIFAVTESDPSYKEAFPNAEVILLKRNGGKRIVIAKAMTDKNGEFALEKVKSGTYILEASATNFQRVVTEIKIINSSKSKNDGLEIGLNSDVTVCCVGYAKVND